MTDPTVEQIRTYLDATGWTVGDAGKAAATWMRYGNRIRMVHKPDDHDLDQALLDIAIAEHRHPADVRDDILNPPDPRISRFIAADMCTRAAAVVRRQLDEAGDDGWPGVWDHNAAWTMAEQATVLAEALDKTAAVIKARSAQDSALPLHPLCRAAWIAAGAILQAEPSIPDDMDAIRARLDAMRAAKAAASGDVMEDGGNCDG